MPPAKSDYNPEEDTKYPRDILEQSDVKCASRNEIDDELQKEREQEREHSEETLFWDVCLTLTGGKC